MTLFLISISAIMMWAALALASLHETHLSLDGHSAMIALAFMALTVAGFFAIQGAYYGESFSANIATEFFGIAITIIVVDRLYEQRASERRKREIIDQMGSPVHDAALEAVRLARKEGWLYDGSLVGASLSDANLREADLCGANLRGVRLVRANLRGADLSEANLQGAVLSSANLQGAVLSSANLQGARLWDANLQDAVLRYANLQGANLAWANLQGADLGEANLQGAVLWNANLQGADLQGDDPRGMSFGILNATAAKYDSYTIWPKGFNAASSGAIHAP